MKIWMVDASVAAKWFVAEELEPQARLLRTRALGFVVPDLFYTEMSNMFWKKVFRRQMKRGDAIEALASLLSEPQIRAVPSVPLIPAAFDWAVRFGCTVYDALYLAASAEEGIPLITADRSFWRKAKVSKEGADIVWLGDLA